MKYLKRVALFAVILGGLFLFTGCSNGKVDGSLEEIMAKVYENVPQNKRPMGLTNIEVNDETVESFFGDNKVEYKEALASESMIGSFAHSVILVRAKDGANIEELKNTIKESINPRKWICVWVEEEDVIIKNKGDLIIVIIVEDEETRTKLEQGFDNL